MDEKIMVSVWLVEKMFNEGGLLETEVQKTKELIVSTHSSEKKGANI